MLKNYFLICFRNIRKNKVYSFLNIFGLAIGIASCMLILQYVSFESSYDQFQSNKDQIFRVDSRYFQKGEDLGQSQHTPYKLGPTIKETIPGVSAYTRTHLQYYGAVMTYNGEGDQRRQFFEEDKSMYFVDQAFFDIFDYPLVKGNRDELLTNPMSIVITEEMVEKYMFGEPSPIGKLLTIDGGWYPGTYKITGVLANLPDNSHFSFDFLMPIHDLLKNGQYAEDDGWGWNNFSTYIMLDRSASLNQVAELAVNIVNDRNEEEDEVNNSRSDVVFSSLNDLHLRDKVEENIGAVSEKTLFFFTLIAVFIIAIAWLNYINLATAQAMKRAKEIGIRKVMGAVKNQLVFQFLLEAFVINFIALVLALGMAYIALPVLGGVIDKELTLGIGIQPVNWMSFCGVFTVGTFLSGFYPALVLSRYRPSEVIKGDITSGNKKFGLRQTLVVLQLIIGVFLISGTLAVYKQLQFMSTQDLGMNVDQVISLRGPRVYDDREQMQQKMKVYLEKIRGLAAVASVSGSDAIPGGDYNWGTGMKVEGTESDNQSVKMMWVDEHFHETYGIELLAGRFHSKDLRGEERQVVVNETLLSTFGLGEPENAIGKKMKVGDHVFPIIGVLKDYNWYSLKEKKEPILLNYTEFGSNISIRLSTDDIRNSMTTIQREYESQFPNNPFDYYFMDDFFNRQYKTDQQFGQMFTAFSAIAIIIACLGLFGLASFTLSLRTKEIGIRKVLGASTPSILTLIYKDYLKLIVIASILGIPTVYFAIEGWLEGFAYRVDISVDLLVLPVLFLIIITGATISFQSLRAALANPVTSLKSE